MRVLHTVSDSRLSSWLQRYLLAVGFALQVAHLKDRYRCVTTDLPGFGADSDEYDADVEKNGYSIDEIVRRLERTIEKAGNGEPVTLIAHDWGW